MSGEKLVRWAVEMILKQGNPPTDARILEVIRNMSSLDDLAKGQSNGR